MIIDVKDLTEDLTILSEKIFIFKKVMSNTEKFIEESIKVHGDKYDYSQVNYIKNSENVIIICKIHGEFLQQPNNHIVGSGCKKCTKPKMTKDEFLEKKRVAKAGNVRQKNYKLIP